jgi:hypothetical protein
MRTQPFGLEALQDIDALRVELDDEPESDTDESFGASRGILLAFGLCVPFWVWVYAILF